MSQEQQHKIHESHFSPTEDNSFISEDVYAETNGCFTKVKCKEIYGFESIATSGDLSVTADDLESLLQFGVEVEYPNGEENILVFQLSNLLHYPIQHRKELIKNMFNNGSIWVGQFDDVFSDGLFPKTWNTIVLPDKNAVDGVFSYRNSGITSLYSTGKEEFVSLFGGSMLVIASFIGIGISVFAYNSMLPLFAVLGVYFILLKYGLSPIDDYSRKLFSMDEPHIWGQLEDKSNEDIAPINSDLKETIQKIATSFTEKWTDGTIVDVSEGERETNLSILMKDTAETITVTYETPKNKSNSYVLNQLVNEIGVGSVRMLDGEHVEVSISVLGKEDDVSKNKTFRIRHSE